MQSAGLLVLLTGSPRSSADCLIGSPMILHYNAPCAARSARAPFCDRLSAHFHDHPKGSPRSCGHRRGPGALAGPVRQPVWAPNAQTLGLKALKSGGCPAGFFNFILGMIVVSTVFNVIRSIADSGDSKRDRDEWDD